MKKYFFFAAAALLALAACSKVTPVAEPDQEISFRAVSYVNSTKADGQGTNQEQNKHGHYNLNQNFGVYAFMTNDTEWANYTGDLVVYMNGVEVARQNVGTAWTPATAYYWPKKGMLTFAAWAPFTAKPTSYAYNADGNVFTYTDYTVAAAADVDLMVSDIADNYTQSKEAALTSDDRHFASEGVPLVFNHILTKLAFQFKEAAYPSAYTTVPAGSPTGTKSIVDPEQSSITITEVKLVNFVYTKDFSNGDWETNQQAGDGEVTYVIENPAELTPGATDAVPSATEPMILPQTLIANPENATTVSVQALYIKYNIKTYYNEGGAITEQDVEATVPFYNSLTPSSTGTANEFKKNQKILFTVTITPFAEDPIKFDPAVVDWDATTTGAIDIK